VAAFFGVALIGAAVTFLVPASHAVDQPNASKRATRKGAVTIPCDVSPETTTSRAGASKPTDFALSVLCTK
jgi:hypothetical protein